MGIEIESGRIVAKNALGQVVLDTDEGQFIVTDYVDGTIALSGYTASNQNFNNSPVNVDTETVLASINAGADIVRGGFFVTTTSGQGNVSSIGWFNAGGSYLHLSIATSGIFVDGYYNLASLAAYTFVAGGGQLKLKQRICLQSDISRNNVTRSLVMSAPTFQYKLFCGAFI